MTKTEQIESKICKVIFTKQCKSKFNNSNFKFIVKLEDENKYTGFMGHEPYEGDIISGIIDYSKTKQSQYDNENEYSLIKPIVKLPVKKEEQIKRIEKLFVDNKFKYYKTEEIENLFTKFKFGSNFWFHLYKHFLEQNGIEGCDIPKDLKIISEHISCYTLDMLKNFKDQLQSRGVFKLTQPQLLELYLHPKFGFDIDKWQFPHIIKLLNICGFGTKSLIKIAIAIKATLDEISQLIILCSLYQNHNGNTCIQYDYKKWKSAIIKDKDIEEIFNTNDNLFNNLTEEKFNTIVDLLITEEKIVKIDNYLFGIPVYTAEHNIARTLNKINNCSNILHKYNLSDYEINNLINKKSKQKTKMKLNQEQKQGIYEIFNSNVSIIYGKAGTGKTSLLSKFIDVYQKVFIQCEKPVGLWFLAPTGKAKIKIEDTLLHKINQEFYIYFETIHAFNFKNKQNKKFNAESENLELVDFDHNIFIIDESSMIDINLLNDFLNITKKINCTLVFLGDNRQLPSVGPGCVLDKLISSEVFKITELIHVVRNGGNITKILDKVIDGQNITMSDCDDKKKFTWLEPKPDGEHDLLLDILNKDASSMIIGTTNNLIEEMTDNIREIINPQNKLKPVDEYIKYPYPNNKKQSKTIYRIGDPVIHCKNNNAEYLANGTQGVISKIVFDDENNPKIVQVKYKKNHKHKTNDNINNESDDEFLDKDYRIVKYDVNTDMLNDLSPAYMITAHKSQGQEYPNIIVVLKKSILLNRNILYTALSRAQKSIILISSKDNLEKCIKRKVKRLSLLDYMFTYYKSNSSDKFSDYYLETIKKNIQDTLLDDNFEEIQCNGQNYLYNKETFETFYYENNKIGELYGHYNEQNKKINKLKNKKQIEIVV